MHDIGKKLGISRERVRQILLNTCGYTHHELLTTAHFCSLIKASRNQVTQLYKTGIITPTFSYNVGGKNRLLWSQFTIQTITRYYKLNRICRMCRSRLPSNRRRYCSDRCHQEGNTYQNLTLEGKERVLTRLHGYRENKRKEKLSSSALVLLGST